MDELQRVQKELDELNDGIRVVIPKFLAHAIAMKRVAEMYIENFHKGATTQ